VGDNLTELQEFRCPLCNKPLASEEYYRAMEELEKKVTEKYDEQNKKVKQDYELKLQQAFQDYESQIESLKRSHKTQIETFRKELEDANKVQLEGLKKSYDELIKENQRQFTGLMEKMQADHKRALEEKDEQIAKIKNEALQVARTEAEREMSKLKNGIQERDIQIERFQRKIEDLEKQLLQSQAELKGEGPERNLYVTLRQAFQDDKFERQKRGTASGDIVQRIRTTMGILDIPIVYDNKQAKGVTKRDIEKAKNYQKKYATNYVIIVSPNLPKKDVKNGLFGEKDAVLLAHPSIVVEVAKQIRKAIIEICRQSESSKDREAKESKLYDYIRSQEFTGNVEKLYSIYQDMARLQNTEEQAHERLWRDRKTIQEKIRQAYTAISNAIDSILQEKPAMQELIEKDEGQRQVKEPQKRLLEPLPVRSKKKTAKQSE
jgi:hypothetical protein